MSNQNTATLIQFEETILPEWIDYNGHMNVAYYVLVFDHATDAVLDHLDLGADYRARTGHSNFVVQSHISYLSELKEGEQVSVASQVLGVDGKRLHLFHTMFDDQGTMSATIELMILNVDMATRRAAPMPQGDLLRIAEVAAAHSSLPRPKQAGRAIAMPVARNDGALS